MVSALSQSRDARVFAPLLLFAVSLLILANGCDAEPNKIADAGAEDVSLRHWNPFGEGAALGEDAHTGWSSLRIEIPDGSTANKHGFEQIVPVGGGATEMFFGAYVRVVGEEKLTENIFTFKAMLELEDGSTKPLKLPIDNLNTDGAWVWIEATRTVNHPVVSAKVSVYGERPLVGTNVDVDDLALCTGSHRCDPDPEIADPPAPTPPVQGDPSSVAFPCNSESFQDAKTTDEAPARVPVGRALTADALEALGIDADALISPAIAARSATLPVMPSPKALATAKERTGCPWDDATLKLWHDPATWNSGVPAGGADVTLPPNSRVLVSSCSLNPTGYGKIVVPQGSALVFADADVHLNARAVEVEGELLIGSATCRVRTSATITLHGERSVGEEKGIIVRGKFDAFGEVYAPTWARLAAPATRGSKTLTLQRCVGWQPGQKIFVTTTQFKDSRNFDWNSRGDIESVDCLRVDGHDYGRVTLKAALRRTHYATEGKYQAEVGLLSRKIVVEGAEADSPPTDTLDSSCSDGEHSSYPCENTYLTGYGGHLMIDGTTVGATAKISSVEFRRMGQTNEIGRYPVHFHLLKETGVDSYLEDSAIHQSHYRCVVLHGTNGTRVSRNVAFDAIGHCYYLEGGNEERNNIEYNLGAHVHPIGKILDESGQTTNKQGIDPVTESSKVKIPADTAASAFYISNLYNNIVGNAASGGWSGFAMPALLEVIGLERNNYPTLTPKDRPTLRFDGNSAHSSGYWWKLASCIYNGGFLYYDANDKLVYGGGRNMVLKDGSSRNTKRKNMDPQTGEYIPNNFTNLQVGMCSVGVTDWHEASEWRMVDLADISDRSYNTFGKVFFENTTMTCRTGNPVAFTGVTSLETAFADNDLKMFRAYDTGQQHMIRGWHVDSCNQPSEKDCAGIWTVPNGINVNQFQTAVSGVTYEQEPDSKSMFACAFDSGRFGGLQAENMLDVDGSLSLRGVPTIIGSAYENAGDFWRLHRDPRWCEYKHSKWPMWMCDQDSISVGYIETTFQPGKNENEDNWSKRAGTIHHWGSSPEDMPALRGYDPGIAGPYDHSIMGGWFLTFDDGAPKKLTISRPQVAGGSTLMLAVSYPSGTEFQVTARMTSGCGSDQLCDVDFTEVDSPEDVRHSAGDVYSFDGTYLYLRVPSVFNQLAAKDGTTWNPASSLRNFTRKGVTIPYMASRNFELEVVAACTSSGAFCDGSISTTPPEACESGTEAPSINSCDERYRPEVQKPTWESSSETNSNLSPSPPSCTSATQPAPTPISSSANTAATPKASVMVIGDWGREGSRNQKDCAAAMAATATKIQSETSTPAAVKAVISTGDNFYPDGLNSVRSTGKFSRSFTDVYNADPIANVKWHSVLGNHDYHGDTDAQLNNLMENLPMTVTGPKWNAMRNGYREFSSSGEASETPGSGTGANAALLGVCLIDTSPWSPKYRNSLDKYDMQDILNEAGGSWEAYEAAQLENLEKCLNSSNAPWKAVVGHHPIVSYSARNGSLEELAGVREVMERNDAPVYMCGHDHNLQHIVMPPVTGNASKVKALHLVLSGAGSSLRDDIDEHFKGTDGNGPLKFAHGKTPGFAVLHASENFLRIDYHVVPDGALSHTEVIAKPGFTYVETEQDDDTAAEATILPCAALTPAPTNGHGDNSGSQDKSFEERKEEKEEALAAAKAARDAKKKEAEEKRAAAKAKREDAQAKRTAAREAKAAALAKIRDERKAKKVALRLEAAAAGVSVKKYKAAMRATSEDDACSQMCTAMTVDCEFIVCSATPSASVTLRRALLAESDYAVEVAANTATIDEDSVESALATNGIAVDIEVEDPSSYLEDVEELSTDDIEGYTAAARAAVLAEEAADESEAAATVAEEEAETAEELVAEAESDLRELTGDEDQEQEPDPAEEQATEDEPSEDEEQEQDPDPGVLEPVLAVSAVERAHPGACVILASAVAAFHGWGLSI